MITIFLKLIEKLRKWFCVDQAIAFSIMTRLWGLATGPITMLLIASKFRPDLQGYYFTFNSLLALQVFAELGLGSVVIQFASHEWSKLSYDVDRGFSGDSASLSRLISLGRFAMAWFVVAAMIILIGLCFGGYYFFKESPDVGVNWSAPWFALCILTSAKIVLLPIWSLLEGCNQVRQIYTYRFIENLFSVTVLWISIYFDAGLWAPAVSSVTCVTCSFIFIFFKYNNFVNVFKNTMDGPSISFFKEVWPMQWRMAVSWASGYLMFTIFTPLLFHYQGAIVAGQMGMTWSGITALSTMSNSFIYTKAPSFGVLIANRDYGILNKMVRKSMYSALSVCSICSIVVISIIAGLNYFHFPIANRLLPPFPVAILLLATTLMQISYAQSTFLRAHKREPFWVLSLFSGVLMAVLSWFSSKYYGANGVAVSYLVVVALAIPMGTKIWWRCRKMWQFEKSVMESNI